jgi:hypothetical protein
MVNFRRLQSIVPHNLHRARYRLHLLLILVSFILVSVLLPLQGPASVQASNMKMTECKCGKTAGRSAAHFVAQVKYNVCEIACDSAGNLISDIPEFETILEGYRSMRNSRVEICMLCRDAGGVVQNIVQRTTHMSQFFQTMHVTMIENDSVDNTVDLLRNWSRKVGNTGRLRVAVENYQLQSSKTSLYPPSRIYDSDEYKLQRETRYGRMSILRNRCLQQVLKRPDTKYLIITDADEDLNHATFQMDGIAHSF